MTDQLEMIDIHAHILPGIDDGARNWEETGHLLEAAWAQGVRHIIATPHFSRKTDMEQLRQLKAGVRELAHRKGLELEISLGQELRYFEELPLYLEQGRALTLAESRYALVEFKPGDGFQTIRRAVRELVQSGFIPVLAHAERYLCLRERFFRNYPYHSPFAYISFAAKSALLHLPYIVRFTIFNLLFVPSTKPFESSLATEFSTASISFSNPFANRDISFKSEFLYRSINKYNRGILFFSYISRNSRTQCINSLSLGYFCKIYALWFSLSSTPIQR